MPEGELIKFVPNIYEKKDNTKCGRNETFLIAPVK